MRDQLVRARHLILLADGTRKPIEKLTLKDKVVATGPASGKTSVESVVRTITGQGVKDLAELRLVITGPNRTRAAAQVTATANHPFYVPAVGRWMDAGQLAVGNHLASLDGTRSVVVDSISRYQAVARVYNLTVNDVHTYYVVADQTPVLVHNCPRGGAELGKRGRAEGLPRDPDATGDHTVFERNADGVVTRYQTWLKNDKNPTGWQRGPRFRGTGGTHAGIEPPLYYPTGAGKGVAGATFRRTFRLDTWTGE